MTTKLKTKRKLSDIDFSKEDSHIALVSKQQGGPASGADYVLVLKAKYSQEAVAKMQAIQVTLALPEFLEKFFHMYGSDAEVLARLMGYVPEEQPEQDSGYNWKEEHEKYIQDRLSAFTVMKSLYDAKDKKAAIAGLDENEYLTVLKAQELFEKLTKDSASAGEGSTEAVVKTKVSDENNTKVEPSPSVDTNVELEKSMKLEEVQKSLDDTKVELQKALEALAAVNAEKQQAIVKSKTAQIEAVVKNAAQSAVLVKAALLLEPADFDGFVAVIKDMATVADKSALFQEQGATSTEEVSKSKESAVAKALKLQLAK